MVAGTVIATFNDDDDYQGHAAIYVRQDPKSGIYVYDQWVTGHAPKPIRPRWIKWDGYGVSNNGNGFCVVDI